MSQQPVAIITGAGRGIGQAAASLLARDGFAVGVLDIDGASAEACAVSLRRRGFNALAVQADVSQRDLLENAVDEVERQLGPLRCIVNNAMWIRYWPTLEFKPDEMERMLDIGLRAVIWGCEIAGRRMSGQGGAIVNLASPAADVGLPGAAIYSAVKGGVSALTRSLAVEFGPLGIRVNAVSPGATPTPGAMEITGKTDEAHRAARLARIPLGRLAEPDDIAEGIAFLASERARYITGHILRVDGGITINGR